MLWVKGSGGDIGSMKLDGFATLYMDKLDALKGLYRGVEHEDEMVGYLPHCTFNLNPRAASIDTPLHAYRAATRMSTTCIPTRSSPSPPRRTRERADRRRSSATRSAGCRGSARASSSACGSSRFAPRATRSQGRRARRATASSPGATTPKDCYETTLAHHQQGASTGSTRTTRGKPAFGGAARRGAAGGASAAPSRRG